MGFQILEEWFDLVLFKDIGMSWENEYNKFIGLRYVRVGCSGGWDFFSMSIGFKCFSRQWDFVYYFFEF